MTTAFVLGGGASLGAVEVGMLQALAERGVTPDLLVGTSVGAINAAFVADSPGVDGLAGLVGIWEGLHRNDVFPFSASTLMRAALRRDHVVSEAPLRNLIARSLGYEDLEQTAIPLLVVATEVTTGLEVVLSRGSAVEALMASAAIPGVFPPVRVGDRLLFDGGVTNHTPISAAVAAGADVVYVLTAGYACALREPPADALGMALHALALLTAQQLIRDVRDFQEAVDLRVLPPPCPVAVAPTDFSHSTDLIALGRDSARGALDAPWPKDQTDLLGLHRHG
jgi:NTE family protein